MVTFGTKKSEAPVNNGSGVWLRNFQRGETVVRFLDEIEDWVVFKEHYNSDKHWFPCTGDNTCPGCTSDDEQQRRKSTKYATNVYLVKTGEVKPYKLPVTLANALERRAERNSGTITNRDYAVLKSGTGMETTYDVDQESKYELDLADLRKQSENIEEILRDRYEEVIGEVAGGKSDSQEVKPAKEEFPFKEAAVESAAEEEPEVAISESKVRSMSITQLNELASDAKIDVSSAESKSEMADIIISALA